MPHITIKTLLSYQESLDLIKKYNNEYNVSFQDNIYDFNNISYHENKKDE